MATHCIIVPEYSPQAAWGSLDKPATWNPSNNRIEVIGGGGNSDQNMADPDYGWGGGGGAGGDYAFVTNVPDEAWPLNFYVNAGRAEVYDANWYYLCTALRAGSATGPSGGWAYSTPWPNGYSGGNGEDGRFDFGGASGAAAGPNGPGGNGGYTLSTGYSSYPAPAPADGGNITTNNYWQVPPYWIHTEASVNSAYFGSAAFPSIGQSANGFDTYSSQPNWSFPYPASQSSKWAYGYGAGSSGPGPSAYTVMPGSPGSGAMAAISWATGSEPPPAAPSTMVAFMA